MRSNKSVRQGNADLHARLHGGVVAEGDAAGAQLPEDHAEAPHVRRVQVDLRRALHKRWKARRGSFRNTEPTRWEST